MTREDFMALRRLWRVIFAAAVLALVASPAFAANHIKAELVASGPIEAGKPAQIAVHFTPDQGWHGYWINPGDAGLGAEFEWQLPAGAEMGEARYPIPEAKLFSGLMNHVYEREYAVLFQLKLPANSGAAELKVKAKWLACTDKICVPESAELSLRLPVKGSAKDARFATWNSAIPPSLSGCSDYAIAGKSLRLKIPMPKAQSLPNPHIFIANKELVDYAAPQNFWRSDEYLIAEIPLKGASEKPKEIAAILRFGDEEAGSAGGVSFIAVPVSGPIVAKGFEALAPAAAPQMPPLALLILSALAGGLLLNLMPCVFPILSLKALALARSGASESAAKREALAYSAGVILSTLALGALLLVLREGGEQVGWAFQLQNPFVVALLMLIAAAISLNLLGAYHLPQLSGGKQGAGAFMTGVLASIAATPCTGPFMAAAMGAALVLPVLHALLLFAALGLGIAAPFLAIGYIPALRTRLPKPGLWMAKFQRMLAFPMLATFLALLWLTTKLGGKGFAMMALIVVFGMALGFVITGRLQRAGKMAWPAFGLVFAPFALFGLIALPSSVEAGRGAEAASLLSPRVFTPAAYQKALEEGRANNRAIFVWFTADWCLSCKVNESAAIERAATEAAFKKAGVIAMRGDWTRGDPEITAFLQSQGAAGVPLYLWIEPGKAPQQLPQVLSPDLLPELAGRAR